MLNNECKKELEEVKRLLPVKTIEPQGLTYVFEL